MPFIFAYIKCKLTSVKNLIFFYSVQTYKIKTLFLRKLIL